MRTKLLAGTAVFGFFSTLTAAAVPDALVDAVQAPVWVERAERRLALAPGMPLENRDRVLTGSGARLIVKLADGSTVKLGENVNVRVNAMKQGEQGGQGFFTAALDVSKGAFRLSTDIFRKRQMQRSINIRAGMVTIGIRGTAVWGRSGNETDLVCLLEGHVVASHPMAEPTELTEPLQFYAANKGQAPVAVASVEPGELARWALETELQHGLATQQTDGRWTLNFGRFDKDGALTLHDQLSAAGYAGRIRPVLVSGGYLYELRLEKLVTGREAQLLADKLVRDLQFPVPAIRRY